MPDTLFSWDSLLTLSGASLLTFLVTLYTSRIVDRWWKLGTDLYAVLWAFLILTLAELGTGIEPWDWRLYLLAFFNSFLVAAAAGKINDKSIYEKNRRKEELKNELQRGGGVNGSKRDWPQI